MLIVHLCAACAVHLLPLTLAGASSTRNATRVRYGIFASPAPFQVAATRRWFDQLLPGYEFEWIPQSSGGLAVKKLENDELEFALMGNTPFAWGAGRGASIRSFYLEHMSRDSECLAVRASITQPGELAGTTIATPAVSTSHFQLLGVLHMFKLLSVTVVLLSPSDIVSAWDAGTIDGAYVWTPALQHILEDGGHTLICGGQVTDWRYASFVVHCVRNNFADAHPHVVDMMARALVLLNDDKISTFETWTEAEPDLYDFGWMSQKTVWAEWSPALILELIGEKTHLPGEEQFSCANYYVPGDPTCQAVHGMVMRTRETADFMFEMKWLPTQWEGSYYQSFVTALPLANAINMTSPTLSSLRSLPAWDLLGRLEKHVLSSPTVVPPQRKRSRTGSTVRGQRARTRPWQKLCLTVLVLVRLTSRALPSGCPHSWWLGTAAPGSSLPVRQISRYAWCSPSFPHSERRTTSECTTAETRLETSFCS